MREVPLHTVSVVSQWKDSKDLGSAPPLPSPSLKIHVHVQRKLILVLPVGIQPYRRVKDWKFLGKLRIVSVLFIVN